jgi:hypothetical protein
MPLNELIEEIRLVEKSLKEQSRRSSLRSDKMTDDWQARELLAELGSRQTVLFDVF